MSALKARRLQLRTPPPHACHLYPKCMVPSAWKVCGRPKHSVHVMDRSCTNPATKKWAGGSTCEPPLGVMAQMVGLTTGKWRRPIIWRVPVRHRTCLLVCLTCERVDKALLGGCHQQDRCFLLKHVQGTDCRRVPVAGVLHGNCQRTRRSGLQACPRLHSQAPIFMLSFVTSSAC